MEKREVKYIIEDILIVAENSFNLDKEIDIQVQKVL